MTRSEEAVNYFKEGYNCAQSVVLAFKDLLPNYSDLLKVSSPFGGGISRLRETCGAVSGMVIVLGSIEGYNTPETGDKKSVLYQNIQDLLGKFEKKFGFLTCRDLLGIKEKHSSPSPSKRDENFYITRPCCALIAGAVEILEIYLKSKKLINLLNN